jgi:hypothetical protein
MGLFDFIFGKKKQDADTPSSKVAGNGFSDREIGRHKDLDRAPQGSILFRDSHKPEWLLNGKPVPETLTPSPSLGSRPPEIPPIVRQKVGKAMEGRFQMSSDSAKLISLLNSNSADAGEITQAVTRDPNLVTRILKVVNSAQFGLAMPIHAVGRAVVLLGFNNIRAIALADAVSLNAVTFEDAARTRMLWMNSAVTSACAASLAKKLGNGVDMGDAATAGLLSNIGKMLMKVEETGKLSQVTGLPPCVVEGFVGSCFAGTWGLPVLTGQVLETASVSFHYSVENIPMEFRKIALTVAFASFITRWYGFSNGDTPELPSQEFLDAINWKAPSSGHWIEGDTALEMEKARTAMQLYLS